MKKINKISSNILVRQYKLLKLGVSSGSKLIKNRPDNLKDALSGALEGEVHKIVNELGVMKGPLMKLGQFLAMYSDSIIPERLQKVLTQLENKSFYLRWEEIETNIPKEWKDQLDIEQTPIAAASLGQVHKAKIGEEDIVLKIQYKGVRKAIDSDVRVLKYLLKLFDFIPKDMNLKPFYAEIKEMLLQETDYGIEAKNTIKFKELVGESEHFYVPKVYTDFSCENILSLEYINGISLRDIETLNIPQDRRNELGAEIFNLFFKEAFEWGLMQTDPNAANYLVFEDDENWKLALIDFGATKELTPRIQSLYKTLIGSITKHDLDAFIQGLFDYEYLLEEERDKYDLDLMREYISIVCAPFKDQEYDWATSEIPNQVVKMAPRVMKEISIKNPPKEILFIDRKIGGVFFLMKILKAKFNPMDVAGKWFKESDS